jgi:hypothetical protein
MGCLPPSRRIRNRRPIIRSAMRSPPMTATSIRTTQNYGRLPSELMKTASRSPTGPRLSTAIPTIGPIPRKGHRRLCRHNRRPIRHPGRTLFANESLASYLKTTRAFQPLARCPHQRDRTGFVEIRRRSDLAARPRRVSHRESLRVPDGVGVEVRCLLGKVGSWARSPSSAPDFPHS